MKKSYSVTLAVLVLLGALCTILVIWVVKSGSLFDLLDLTLDLTDKSTQIVLMDTGESYTMKEPVTISGDGARCFYFYKTATKEFTGKACSGEGFNESDQSPLEVWATGKGRPEDLVMFYKPSTKQLFRADNDCELSATDATLYQDKDLGISVQVPRSLQIKKTTSNNGVIVSFYGETAWCTSVTMQHSVEMKRYNSFEVSGLGDVKTTVYLQSFLERVSPRFEVMEQNGETFFIVTDTLGGTAGGPKEYVVWFATGSSVYNVTFDRYMNLGNVKSFLGSIKLL